MTYPTVSKFPTASGSIASTSPASWDRVARICRRICLLRERGDESAADALTRETLATALADFRAASAEMADEVEARLHATFEAEHERVANAATLAEFLAPLIREHLVASAESGPSPRAVATVTEPPPATPFEPRRRPTDVADFIDEMIAQERSPPPPARRAS